MNKKPHKPFRDSSFGIWLREHDSELFEFIAARIKGDRPLDKALKFAFLLLAKLTKEKYKEAVKVIDGED